MISIVASRTKTVVSGHALFAPKGNDIVCAAVSGIVLGAQSLFSPSQFKVDKKSATITISLSKAALKKASTLQVINTQLRSIAESYPQFVKVSKE